MANGVPYERTLSLNPEDWWISAHEAYLAARALRAENLVMPCMFYCQGLIEKALKAACCEENTLKSDDATHGLVRLARKAGFYDSLTGKAKSNLKNLSNLREVTNYPTSEFRRDLINNPLYSEEVYNFTCFLYRDILDTYGRLDNRKDYPAGESNDS